MTQRADPDPPVDFSGLSDAERVEVSTSANALAAKVGGAAARRWARERVAEILRERNADDR